MRTYLTVGLPFSRLTCDEEIKSMEGINNILSECHGRYNRYNRLDQ